MIRLTQVKITNFLSFEKQIVINEIKPISVFVGPNNFGKSNLVRCLNHYHNLSKSELRYQEQIQEMKHRHGLAQNFSIEVMYDYVNQGRSAYPLEITHFISYDNTGNFETEQIRFKRKEDEVEDIELRVFIQEKANGAYSAYLQNTQTMNAFLFDLPAGRTPGLELVSNVKSYGAFRWEVETNTNAMKILKELREFVAKWVFIPPNRALGSDNDVESLRSDGSNTVHFLGREAQEARMKVGRLLAIIFKLTDTRDLNIKNVENTLTILVSDLPEEQVKLKYYGSGFGQILILLTSIFQEYHDNTIFFIEEPETHLHAGLQRKLLHYLIKRAKHNQFFVTTHSTIFCRHLPGVVQPYLVKKMNYQTQFEVIGENAMQEIKSILGHANTDLFAYNAVLFIEGETEEKNLPLLAKYNGIDFVDAGIRILNSRGYGNMTQLKNIVDLVRGTGTDVYAIFDDHREDQGELVEIKNKLDADCYDQLSGGFEDCFSDLVLMEAISKLCLQDKSVFNNEELDNIKKDLSSRNQNAMDVIKRHYFMKTNRSISKVDFGEALVKAAKEKGEVGKSKPEQLLFKIQEKINKKLAIGE